MSAAAGRQWVALLRGVNVGGHRRVPMAPLRAACEAAGLEDVRTYVASGNLVCRSAIDSEAALADHVATIVRDSVGVDVEVVARSAERLLALRPAFEQTSRLHVGFLAAAPAPQAVQAATDALLASARLVVDGDHLQLHTPGGLGARWIRGDLERLLGVPATLRAWRTVEALAAMLAAP